MSVEIPDIPNWTSLIVEIGVAIFAIGISIFFYRREKAGHKESQSLIVEQKKVIESMKNIIDFQKNHVESQIFKNAKQRTKLNSDLRQKIFSIRETSSNLERDIQSGNIFEDTTRAWDQILKDIDAIDELKNNHLDVLTTQEQVDIEQMFVYIQKLNPFECENVEDMKTRLNIIVKQTYRFIEYLNQMGVELKEK